LEETCQDCRETPLNEIYTAHFTVCGKPDWCTIMDPDFGGRDQLCMDLFREWHKTRLSLEEEWMAKFEGYIPNLRSVNVSESRQAFLLSYKQGHCLPHGEYLTMTFPSTEDKNVILIE
jgi:hypothetical protein